MNMTGKQTDISDRVSKDDYRSAMSFLPGGVNIITTIGPTGRAGFTASAVCSVTDEPPTLLVCVKRDSSVGPAFMENADICVNVIGSQHEILARLFGGKTAHEERFEQGEWISLVSGAPVLKDAVVAFDCKVTSFDDVGTHRVLFCEVLAIADNQAPEVSVYVARKFHSIALRA